MSEYVFIFTGVFAIIGTSKRIRIGEVLIVEATSFIRNHMANHFTFIFLFNSVTFSPIQFSFQVFKFNSLAILIPTLTIRVWKIRGLVSRMWNYWKFLKLSWMLSKIRKYRRFRCFLELSVMFSNFLEATEKFEKCLKDSGIFFYSF